MGYRTCYYRTFNVGRATPAQHDAYKMAREWLDNAIDRIKPGASTAHICEVFPKADEFGFPDEMSAFGLQFAHGLGLNLHERPIISRVVSMDHPTEIKEGMVFAIETYCPATDGYSAARIEEEVVVTDKGCRLISLFPAEELPIAQQVLSATVAATSSGSPRSARSRCLAYEGHCSSYRDGRVKPGHDKMMDDALWKLKMCGRPRKLGCPPRAAQALWRGFRGRCPACGEGRMFRAFLKVADECPHCGEELHHHRADDFPAYLVIVIVGHILVPIIAGGGNRNRPGRSGSA